MDQVDQVAQHNALAAEELSSMAAEMAAQAQTRHAPSAPPTSRRSAPYSAPALAIPWEILEYDTLTKVHLGMGEVGEKFVLILDVDRVLTA